MCKNYVSSPDIRIFQRIGMILGYEIVCTVFKAGAFEVLSTNNWNTFLNKCGHFDG